MKSFCATIILFFINALLVQVIGHDQPSSQVENNVYSSGNLNIELVRKIKLQVTSNTNKYSEVTLKGELGTRLPSSLPNPSIEIRDEILKVNWGSDLTLQVTPSDNKRCHRFVWTSKRDEPLEDCFNYGKAKWFGGPEIIEQLWPVEKFVFKELPYVTQMYENIALTEPYWLNSNGAYIYVNTTTPLFIDSNNHKPGSICFIANDVSPYLKRPQKILDYHLCGLSNPRAAQMHVIRNFIGKPEGIPDKRMIEHPVWSTWVRYKSDINETSVLDFAKQIVQNGFNNSQIEIDDNWETCYGSTVFNKSRFSNMKELSNQLKELGFRITIWVHPFVNLNCPLHEKVKSKGYFIENVHGNISTVWWDGDGSVVDLTKPNVVSWFRKLHEDIMKNNGIDGLKFDAGETSWLPQIPVLNCPIDSHPNAFTSAYVDAVSKFNDMTEVRVGHRTQKYPMFLRMLDKDSKWTFQNGLPTLITTMLVMNIQGYSFVLPDMVGGNAYSGDVIDKELFIRWLQANTFMPVIQFSAVPWDYDFETTEISRKFTALHYRYSAKIIQLMEKTVKTGKPLNPPIWWVDPSNPTAHSISSEYMLGEDILVAPVIERGAVRRDIYLPKGYWRDENHPHKIYSGRQWLRGYYADLKTLPYFTKVSRSSFLEASS